MCILEMMTNGYVLTDKIDFAILKLSFKINVILSSALRTNLEIFGRQFLWQCPIKTSDLVGFSQTIKLLAQYKLGKKHERQSDAKG